MITLQYPIGGPNEDALGLLPAMIYHGDEGAVKNLETNYQFFMGWNDPGSARVDEEGTFSYPGDPDLAPLLRVLEDGVVAMYIYPHAIVVKMEDDKLVGITRCD